MGAMLTRDELAEMLADVNVEDVARESGISTKTIYRMRHKKHAPTLDTIEAVLNAVERLKLKSKDAAKSLPAAPAPTKGPLKFAQA